MSFQLTTWERVRIWIAFRVFIPSRIWRLMCDLGYCPVGIHAYRQEQDNSRTGGQEREGAGRDGE